MSDLTIFAPLAGWVTPLAQVPDAVFAEKMLGDGIAIDPVNDALCAPCDATVLVTGSLYLVGEVREALGIDE